jgi:hypothetical protein
MKHARALHSTNGHHPGAPSRLRAVSRMAPPRPRWRRLYLMVAAAGLLGVAAHVLLHRHRFLEMADAGFALLVFGAIMLWIHVNRSALARLDEPDAGGDRPAVRVIRSRPPIEERGVLPYDFR